MNLSGFVRRWLSSHYCVLFSSTCTVRVRVRVMVRIRFIVMLVTGYPDVSCTSRCQCHTAHLTTTRVILNTAKDHAKKNHKGTQCIEGSHG